MVKTSDHRCEPVTALMRAIDNVPAGARWRISWMVHAFTTPRPKRNYLLNDSAARRWCELHGIPMPAVAGPGPAVGASRTEASDAAPAVLDRRTTDPRTVDMRARAAGEEPAL